MTSKAFPHLFQPIELGGLRLKNRIVSTGHDTSMIADGSVNEALIAYHRARAAGGAGLIVTQVAGVHDTARFTTHALMIDEDRYIAGFARLAEAVKSEACGLLVQLFHPGREVMESQDGALPVAYAPSFAPSERFHVVPRAMPIDLIQEVVAGYVQGARRIAAAGADGVEIVASHGYLPAQFLNPAVNRRDDAYGGSAAGRRRFLEEVLAGIRAAVAPGFVVGLRISADEMDSEGLAAETALDSVRALEGAIDYVSLVGGTSASTGGAIHIVPPMSIENAYVAPFAAEVKAAVSIPVIVTGRINQPQIAEQVLAAGQADLCGMTRAMICDPEMAEKARSGRGDDIRACIGCNQACIGHFHKGYPISCIQHPETGRELAYGRMAPAETTKSVVVVGAGPAGMKAASTAARRGHQVRLLEAGPAPGGQALLAQLLPERAEFGGIVTNLAGECARAGVTIECRSPVDRATIDALGPDAVIVATGAQPYLPPGLEIDEGAHVVDAWQILRNEANVGASVVVADWRCDWIGMGLAEKLAREGCRVRLAVNGLHAGEMLPFYVRDAAVARLHRLGVEVLPYARLYGCDQDTVYLQHTASGDPVLLDEVDTLVLAQGHAPQDGLLAALADYPGEVVAAGDCLAPRTAEEAVLEGLKAGWAL